MSDPRGLWEYKVVHLNVENDRPAAGTAPSEPPAAPVPFTKTYLEQEFPNYYTQTGSGGSGDAAASSPQPQHPAQQLQGFLNGQGREGWELLGIYPLGKLLMMIFRRPQPAAPKPDLLLEDGTNLDAAGLAALCAHPRVSTSAAARALGFRSVATLTNQGLRSGYPLGLLKQGRNGQLAVYVAAQAGAQGGNPRRLWVVLTAQELHRIHQPSPA